MARCAWRPVKELETLRADEKTWRDVTLASDDSKLLEGVGGDACELEIVVDSATASKYGVKVRMSPGCEEETLLYYDAAQKSLCFDATRSGVDGRRVLEQAPLSSARVSP